VDEDVDPSETKVLREDVFCEQTPELAADLGFEHHQCVRLLKAVYGLVNAPRRWYQRVSKDFAKLGGVENTTEPCLWTFRNDAGEIIGLVVLYVDDALIACAPGCGGQTLLKQIKGLYEWGTWETKAFTQCGAQIVQAYAQHFKQWGGFTISMEDYASEIQMINLSPTRRVQREEKATN